MVWLQLILSSLAHAAGPAEEETTGHEQPSSTSLQDLILQALRGRSKIMFSGESGAPVASDIKDDAATAVKPSYGLVKAAMSIVFDELPDVLFDQHAAHRPCAGGRSRRRPARVAPSPAASEACVGRVRRARRPPRSPRGRLVGGSGAARDGAISPLRDRRRWERPGPRGGSGRAGAGLAVTHGRAGAGRSGGGASRVLLWSPARAEPPYRRNRKKSV